MLDMVEELLRKIQLGEESALELKAVHFKGKKILGPKRDLLADELAAIANTSDGVCVLGVDDKTRAISRIPLDKLGYWLIDDAELLPTIHSAPQPN